MQGYGHIRLLPASEFQTAPPHVVQVWANQTGRYGIVTQELIQWLRSLIGYKNAIEVGSGNGDLWYHLGIMGTDSYMQQSSLTASTVQARRCDCLLAD